MLGLIGAVLTLLVGIATYLAFFWKLNWIKDLRKAQKKGQPVIKIPRCRKQGKLPPVYPNGWFGLMESHLVKKSEVKHVTALGENFAVFRTEKGAVYILDAYCPHLGANMAEGGRVVGDCLECPFHAWRFQGTDGHCSEIPYAKKVPATAIAKKWISREANGIIFVWYHAESAEPDWEPKNIENIHNGTWKNHGRNEFLINCHIQEIPENGADIAHLNCVHGPAMLLNERLPWLARHYWTNAAWSQQPSAESKLADEKDEAEPKEECDFDNPTEKHRAYMKLKHRMVFLQRFGVLDVDINVHQIGPGYVELYIHTPIGELCILQIVTPMEPLLQRVIHVMYTPPLLAPYATLVFLGECLMFERDVAIWNHKRFEKQPILVSEDRSILAYRRWYSQFYSTNSPDYYTAKQSLLW